MNYKANSIDEYLDSIPQDRKEVMIKLRNIFSESLPQGFSESFQYNMITYVVPFHIYPNGYHVDSNTPLPFISLASQKNHIAIYHLALYMKKDLLDWFTKAYQDLNINKLDMGKSCIRFKNINKIPFDLIRELAKKISVEEYIKIYEESRIR